MGGMSSQIIWKQAWSPDAEFILRQALASQHCSVRELSSQQWDASTASIGGVRDHMTSYLAPASASWSSVMLHLNSLVAEPVAAELSRLISGPAIAVMEYDQAAWGYTLFESGPLRDRFWSLPDAVETPPDECAGSVDVVARAFGVPVESITPYIRHVTESDYDTKAFDDDEFTLGDHWVRVDFMRRLGVPCPSPGQVAGGRYVQIQEARR
jgi:hypothetical protein